MEETTVYYKVDEGFLKVTPRNRMYISTKGTKWRQITNYRGQTTKYVEFLSGSNFWDYLFRRELL